MECKVRYVHEAIAETRVKIRNAAMTMKRLKYNIFYDEEHLANTLYNDGSGPFSLFRETICLCICHDSRHSLCFRFWQVFRTDAWSQSMEWPVSSACSARAEDSLSPVYGQYTLEREIPPPWQNCCAKSLFSAMGYILRRYGSSGAVITKKRQKNYINY